MDHALIANSSRNIMNLRRKSIIRNLVYDEHPYESNNTTKLLRPPEEEKLELTRQRSCSHMGSLEAFIII